MKKRVLLVAAKAGYQVREFDGAAERLGLELALATDRCHMLDDPWADRATPIQFEDPAAGIEALRQRGPFDGVVAVGDRPATVAAEAAVRLGLRFHTSAAARAASDKFLTRERFQAAGLPVPSYSLDPAGEPRYPCVLKPLHFSASRGVIRANNAEEFGQAAARIRKMTGGGRILVEDFIPGREFALEGIVSGGMLQTLALFDKPDPLDGPFFEETIYVTPSRETAEVRREIRAAAQKAVTALGLTNGPVHAEMRVNSQGVWMLEAAARPIGGLCARVLRFDLAHNRELSLEEILLLHAIGEDVSTAALAPGAHAVMMIPIRESGIFEGVDGVERAGSVRNVTQVEITAKKGQKLEALPEGASYLGFLFARAGTPEKAEQALRQAHQCLQTRIISALPVMK
ncbi:MAG TPA: ATP-grasp domain-containing protein [Bryobacteraceae bacterium]|nr:ATP-grasp domain-containing protein [Bryobacteraceae bacterium]